jgi:hypothetical protein
MTVPSWDPSLPTKLEQDDYAGEFPETTIKSDPDMGPSKVRGRFTAGVEPLTGVLIMSPSQFATFRTFYKSTLLNGALRFAWTEPPLHTTACEMRFTKVPTWALLGDHYKVSVSLEILP